MGQAQRASLLKEFDKSAERLLGTRLARFILELRESGIDLKIAALDEKAKTGRLGPFAFEDLFHRECNKLSWSFVGSREMTGRTIIDLVSNSSEGNALAGRTISVRGKKMRIITIQERSPREEAVDEFLLALRPFVGRDGLCSLENLWSVYDKLPVSDQLKKSLYEQKEAFRVHLDKKQRVVTGYWEDGRKAICWPLSQIILEADHTSEDPNRRTMRNLFDIVSFVYTEFVNILLIVRCAIDLNRKALEGLERRERGEAVR